MPLTKDLVQQVGRTTDGNMTFVGNLGGLIPTGAKFIISRNTSQNVNAIDSAGGIGFCDATNEGVASFQSEDGVLTTNTDRRTSTAACIQLLTAGSNVVLVEASFVSFTANTVTVNFGTTDGTAYEIMCILYAGVSASMGNFSPNASQNSGTTVSGLGFFPRYIDFVACNRTASGASANTKYNIGASVLFNSSIVQGNQANNDQNNQGTSNLAAITNNNRIFQGQLATGVLTYSLEITNMSSGQFIATTRDAAGDATDVVFYLALGTDVDEVNLIQMDTPATAISVAYTGLGFKPDFFTMFGGGCTSYNTLFGSIAGLQIPAEPWELSYFDDSQNFCQMLGSEDNAGTSNTFNRLQNNVAIQIRDGAAGQLSSGQFTSFDNDGLTLNYTGAASLRKLIGVGFKEPSLGIPERHYPRGNERGITRGVI